MKAKSKRKPATMLAWAVRLADGKLAEYSVWPGKDEAWGHAWPLCSKARIVRVRVTEVVK